MRVVLVPGVLALLPAHRSLEDPVAPLRAACLEALGWLGRPSRIVADASGHRVAEALLESAGLDTPPPGASGDPTGAGVATTEEEAILVVGNGSARRTDASPGPFDARAVPFDDALGTALRGPEPTTLRSLDVDLAEELWAAAGCFAELADLLEGARLVDVDYDEAPYGVQYWVMRWQA